MSARHLLPAEGQLALLRSRLGVGDAGLRAGGRGKPSGGRADEKGAGRPTREPYLAGLASVSLLLRARTCHLARTGIDCVVPDRELAHINVAVDDQPVTTIAADLAIGRRRRHGA